MAPDTAPASPPLDSALRTLELRMLGAIVRGDEPALAAMLAPDFIEFCGAGRVLTRDEVLERIRRMPRPTATAPTAPQSPPFEAAHFTLRPLPSGAALLTYRLAHPDPRDPARMQRSFRASVWRPATAANASDPPDEGWQLACHHFSEAAG